MTSGSLRNPIVLMSVIAVAAVVGMIAWPQYAKQQEQSARRECAEQITQKRQEMKQARTEWDRQCDEAKRLNKRPEAIGVAAQIQENFIEHSCEALYGAKPPAENTTVDEERELIKLCMERKGY